MATPIILILVCCYANKQRGEGRARPEVSAFVSVMSSDDANLVK